MMNSSTALVVRKGFEEDGERLNKELAEDLITEIFARLPVKSLFRFRCVSKRWYSLILSPNFIVIHSSHSHSRRVSLLCDSRTHSAGKIEKTIVSVRFGDFTQRLTFHGHIRCVRIVGCFNGVVCLSLSSKTPLQKYVLWNPATRNLKSIKVFSFNIGDWYGSGFCFDPAINAFKVTLLILTDTAESKTRAQIHVYSTATNSWTKKNIAVPYRIRLSGSDTIRGATCVNEKMYWHVTIINTDTVLEEMYLLCYNMIDEVFQRIQMPTNPVHCHYSLASYKGSLAVFVHRQSDSDRPYTDVDVWVMNVFGASDQSWAKILTCRPSIQVNFAVGFVRKDDVDLVLFCKNPDFSLYLYNPQNGETKWFWKTASVPEAFLYEDSLVPLY